ncbi:hypothetical protein Rsub_08316 [Raphidocelis subcapitata]|uniref:DUF1995 domain-containing protein n=1 Tax=Raphidocelis subcapitata TaxID=307507 RepID=A0A2V0PDW7_9CHLO|nr:hypothetical protein Rsub_08316 [Raphidocelis subcapitata]|eukprot:GBF95285.1 hypothetical protein Rsub_08316 [Raphidocelis subcapitata]
MGPAAAGSRKRQSPRAARPRRGCAPPPRAGPPGGGGANQFDVDSAAPPEQLGVELGPREDDALPDSLADAVADAAAATADAINRGNTRCQVEILLPEFWDPISGPIFPNKARILFLGGDQERFWRMTRRFVEALSAATGNGAVKAVYPDAGVAAMLSHQWQDRAFTIDSLNSRRPVQAGDELIIVACPDPPGAEDCLRTIAEQDEREGIPERPVVLFNQRLSGGDVGIGLNARRMRNNFLDRFTVTYSLRPVGDVGTVFRRYPGMWKVFVEEPELPGRYRMVAERPGRPAGEALDYIIDQALNPGGGPADGAAGGAAGGAGDFGAQLRQVATGMARFMRSLSN